MNLTLGELVDRLSITNIKLFLVQERAFEAAEAGTDLDADSTGNLTSLNLQRNALMTAIDEPLDRAVKTGHADVDPRIKLVPRKETP